MNAMRFCRLLVRNDSITGLSMFSRYMNLPEKTAAEFCGVFFKTGDIAARERVGDDALYFKILGRASMVVLLHLSHSMEK
jgi:long-subunit acyl-CoA synthetase (AMP-forming)